MYGLEAGSDMAMALVLPPRQHGVSSPYEGGVCPVEPLDGGWCDIR